MNVWFVIGPTTHPSGIHAKMPACFPRSFQTFKHHYCALLHLELLHTYLNKYRCPIRYGSSVLIKDWRGFLSAIVAIVVVACYAIQCRLTRALSSVDVQGEPTDPGATALPVPRQLAVQRQHRGWVERLQRHHPAQGQLDTVAGTILTMSFFLSFILKHIYFRRLFQIICKDVLGFVCLTAKLWC